MARSMTGRSAESAIQAKPQLAVMLRGTVPSRPGAQAEAMAASKAKASAVVWNVTTSMT